MRRQRRDGPGSVYVSCIVALVGSFFIGIGTLALWQASSMPDQSEAWRESLRSGGYGSRSRETEIDQANQSLRGYEGPVLKLKNVGAQLYYLNN